ncbi:MAG: hypothetical protein ACOYJG_00635 [Prevotella sp.]|jgi:hypothetical protein
MVKDILNDYEHSVTKKIAENEAEPDFPKLEDYGLEKNAFDTYLFEKQAILDSNSNEKVRYTIWGILMVTPVLVADIFPHNRLPWGEATLLVALVAGFVLCVIYQVIANAVKRNRLRNHYDDKMEKYINDVLNY